MRTLCGLLPKEDIVYMGDTGRAPYGGLPPETILSYSREIVELLISKNVKAVVMACGTSSSVAYETIRAGYPDLILVDVLRPGVAAVKKTVKEEKFKRVGFIATAATVRRGLFAELLKEACPGVLIKSRSCPLFAPMVERGLYDSPLIRWVAESYLGDLRGEIDALVLGCTHYPMLGDVLGEVLPGVRLIDLSVSTAAEVKKQLKARNALNDSKRPPIYDFIISGKGDMFHKIEKNFLFPQKNRD